MSRAHQPAEPMKSQDVITISYESLKSPPNSSTLTLISQAFGSSPSSLGIIAVSDVPSFTTLRQNLLPLSYKLAHLPPDELSKITKESAGYVVGWSHGKEKVEGDRYDTAKGSFYANPLVDDFIAAKRRNSLTTSDCERERLEEICERNPQFYAANVWPEDDVLPLENCFKEMGQLICNVGRLLAKHCDAYVVSRCPGYDPTKLHTVLSSSLYCKGRLLHYFPTPRSESSSPSTTSDWCGWHNDHGSLTGLVPAMYFNNNKDDETKQVRHPPDDDTGLYVKTRSGVVVKVSIPQDCLAFQVGETTQIHTGGVLRATPHCVRRGSGGCDGLSREAFAVFMEPEYDGELNVPEGKNGDDVVGGEDFLPEGVVTLRKRWRMGMNFGEFSEETFKAFY